jgi:hypothetical protein
MAEVQQLNKTPGHWLSRCALLTSDGCWKPQDASDLGAGLSVAQLLSAIINLRSTRVEIVKLICLGYTPVVSVLLRTALLLCRLQTPPIG